MEATECNQRKSRGRAEEPKRKEAEKKDTTKVWETKVREWRNWVVSAR